MQAGAPVVSAPGMLLVSFLPEPDDVKIDEGTMLREQCRVLGFPGVQSSLRCWLETDVLYHGSELQNRLGSVVGVRELSRLYVALHLLRVGVFLSVLHAFWGLLRRVQVLFFLSRIVLSRVTLSHHVWSLHRHVSSASVLLCIVITVHATHIIYRIHTACMVLVVF